MMATGYNSRDWPTVGKMEKGRGSTTISNLWLKDLPSACMPLTFSLSTKSASPAVKFYVYPSREFMLSFLILFLADDNKIYV